MEVTAAAKTYSHFNENILEMTLSITAPTYTYNAVFILFVENMNCNI